MVIMRPRKMQKDTAETVKVMSTHKNFFWSNLFFVSVWLSVSAAVSKGVVLLVLVQQHGYGQSFHLIIGTKQIASANSRSMMRKASPPPDRIDVHEDDSIVNVKMNQVKHPNVPDITRGGRFSSQLWKLKPPSLPFLFCVSGPSSFSILFCVSGPGARLIVLGLAFSCYL